MQKETKNYITVTFSCRGTQFSAVKSQTEGRRMLDWLQEGAIGDTGAAVSLASQLIRILRERALSGAAVMRGFVSPYIFIVDAQDQIHLLDMEDESNQAMARKIRTASVMRYFTPEELLEREPERAEVYGFARLMQFALESGAAGRRMGRADKAHWRRLLERCMGERPRRIRDFDQADKAFRALDKTGTGRAAGKRAPRVRRPFLIAACLLAAVFLLKKGVYDQAVTNHLLQQDQARLTSRLREMEDSLEDMRLDQKKMEHHLKNE